MTESNDPKPADPTPESAAESAEPAAEQQSTPPVPPTPTADTAPVAEPAAEPGRLYRLRSVVAVGAAGLVLGGFGGGAVAALVDGDDRPDGPRDFREHGPGDWSEERGEMPIPPGGMMPPRQDEPDDSGDGATEQGAA